MSDLVHDAELNEYPEEWKSDYVQLSRLVRRVADRYAGRIVVRVTDVQSPQGLWKSIRHRIRTYPTWLVGEEQVSGWDEDRLTRLIERQLAGAA